MFPHEGQAKVTSSMSGRCGSIPVMSRPTSVESSSSDPTEFSWPVGQIQIGSGVPQYLSRESDQSTLFASQSPYRPCLMCSGYQLTVSFAAKSSSLNWVVLMYHAARA